MPTSVVSGTSDLAQKLCEVLGLKQCNAVTIKIAAGEVVKVEAVFYPTESEVSEVIEELNSKSYILVEVE